MKSQTQPPSPSAAPENDLDIAITGMACRFPGAQNVEQFWKNLADGVESITRLSDEELLQSGVPQALLDTPNYVKAAPILDSPGFFDAAFFGFSPAEARAIDPQHRILLELAYEALENAGCNPDRYPGRIGVFTGSAMNTYFMNSGLSSKFAEDYIPTLIVNDKDFLSTRVSYKLNLKGPSITIQTACSTSLVAVHLARQSLLSHETDMAVAGAISVRVPHYAGYFCDGGGVVSPDGHVRAFDAHANGTVFGSGGGVIVLKRLDEAIAHGDTIHAVIKGSAVNNDGSEKAGYTAPSVNSQADAVLEALANAGVDAESVTYIEAHGSGTPVGDPIEVMALTKAFRACTPRSGYCAIGSVKTNVGHLDAAAGIAGIIKTVLALKHRQLPPSLHYTRSNPEIDFPSTPFYVNTQLRPWTSEGPRRAGVMSTGMGGTNAHVVLEEASEPEGAPSSIRRHLLVFSAKSPVALDATTNRLEQFLKSNAAVKMEDVAFTLQTGRKEFAHRRVLICEDREGAIAALGDEKSKGAVSEWNESTRRPIIFLLPGIGDHYVGMGLDLYEKWNVFREAVDRCADLLEPHLNVDIREIIYPKRLSENKEVKSKGIDLKKMLGQSAGELENPAANKFNQTIYAQPALFTIEYALATLWKDLGVTPDAIVGHSMGEYVAACLAGVFSLEDALRLIAQRARRANELPQAAMLAVLLSEAEILPQLDQHVSISLINGPNLCVVAGAAPAIAEFERTLNTKGVITRRVQNNHAFHSRMLDPIVSSFADDVRNVRLHEPKIPFISNVTGTWMTKADAIDPMYWARHLNHTARFSDALREMWQFKNPILLEVGPGKTLGVLATQHPERRNAKDPVIACSLRHHYENQSDVEFLYHSVGRLWLSGIDIAWENFPGAKSRRKVALPTYPFERQNYWIETNQAAKKAEEKTSSIHRNGDLLKWFYVPSWKRTLPKFIGIDELSAKGKQNWLVFCDEGGVGTQIMDFLKAGGQKVVTAQAGESFKQLGIDNFILEPGKSDDYEALCRTLQSNDWTPEHIVHAWTVSEIKSDCTRRDSFSQAQDLGFYSLLFLARALAKHNFRGDLSLFVLSSHIQQVHGNEILSPEKSTLLGPCMVIPQEYPNIRTKHIDLELSVDSDIQDLEVEQLIGEFFDGDSDFRVAHRNGQRWVQMYEPIRINDAVRERSIFREQGVYLITGGLGNIGYEISKYLAKNYRAKLALLGRSHLPKRKLWNSWIENHPTNDAVTQKLQRIEEIERCGGEVLCLEASVHDLDGMRRAIDNARERFGQVNGVIHGAGIIGDQGYREIRDVDAAHCDLHFQGKANGLQVLETVLAGRPLDFRLLLSSLTSILGGIGQAAYAAANVYMDTFARRHRRLQQPPWLSVNWDVWRLQKDAWGAPGLGKTLAELGMTGDEALKAMEIALPLNHASQVIVSTGDLDARIRQWIKIESLRNKRLPVSARPVEAKLSDRPALHGPNGSHRGETEDVVGQVWREVLGINQIQLSDNFSDLGGHSLLAIKIVAELRKAFQIELPVKALFEAPTIAQLSAYIKKQREEVEQIQPVNPVQRNGEILSGPDELIKRFRMENPKLEVEDAFVVPHWFVQQRNWIENPSGSDSTIYNYPLLLRLCGPLNEAGLQWALQEIVRRHEVLRSLFRVRAGEMLQMVVPLQRQQLQITDLSCLPNAERETRWQQMAREGANRAFDPTREPLFRAELIRLAAEDHILHLTTHHMVHDDWSIAILLRELCECYQAFDAGKTPSLPDLTFQYGDYVRWQEQQLNGERLNARLVYWKKQLAGADGFQHLATDIPRSASTSNRGACERRTLSASLAKSLQEVGRRERVSLFMVLLAGFQSLLHRYSNHEEIGIGTCAANRTLPDVEALIGHFGNDMLLRTNVSGNPTFRELLLRVRDTALSAYSNQDLPFGTLLQKIQPANPQHEVPFQVMFILQNAPQPDDQVPGLRMEWLRLDTETAKYDLTVWIKTEPALEITLEYKTDLFGVAAMRQLLDNYQTILETMVVDLEARVGAPCFSGKTKPVEKISVSDGTKQGSRNRSSPKDEVEARLVELWEAHFKMRPIGVDQNFFELGGDSLLAARLFAQMEKSFQMDLPMATLLEAPTISELARIISSRNSSSLGSSLVAIQTDGTRPPLFCVHGHMGEVFYCRNLSRALGSDQPLYGLRSQGLRGEPLHHTVEEMAVHYVSEIRKVQAHGPYFLSGFCLGGMVAFEMAKLLEKGGEKIALLVLFNAPSPGGLEGWPLNRIYLTKRIAHELKKLHQLPMRQKLAIIGGKTIAFVSLVTGVFKTALWKALPISADGVAARLLSVGDVNVAAAKSYYPTAYPGRATYFLTEEVASLYATDPTEGWRNLARDGIEIHQVAGDNISMFDVRFVDSLAEKLQSCIANAHEGCRPSAPALVPPDPDRFTESARLVPTQST